MEAYKQEFRILDNASLKNLLKWRKPLILAGVRGFLVKCETIVSYRKLV